MISNPFITQPFLYKKRIGSVVKHAPGHGCSNLDSHKKLPIVKKTSQKLYQEDFSAFHNVNSNFMMTAHILYQKIDPNYLATNSKKLASIARIYSTVGKKKSNYDYQMIGYNYRMTNIQAAVGLAQMERLEFFIKQKKIMAKKYRFYLNKNKQIFFF